MEGLGLVAGALVLVVQTSGALWIGWRLACRWWADDLFATCCAALLISCSFVVLALEVLGTVGLLNNWAPLVVTLFGVLAVATYVPAGTPPELAGFGWRRPEAPADGALLAGVVAQSAVLLGTILLAVDRWKPSFDSFASHLPVAMQFVQRQDTWFFPYASPVQFGAHYPANAELLAAWVMAPVSRDVFVQLAGLPGLALLVTATAMLARTLGARTWTAIGVALILPAVPQSLIEHVGTNMQDLLTAGSVVAVFAFAARRWGQRGTACRPDLVLGGLAAGMAMGTRYGAVLTVAPALVALVLPTLLPGDERGWDIRTAARHSLLVIAALVSVGGYFYLRNQVFGGSPIYPESVPWKRIEATERLNFTLVRSYLDLGWQPAIWRRGLGFVRRDYGIVPLGLLAVTVLLPLLALVRRARSLRTWVFALAPLAAALAFVVTPAAPGVVVDGMVEPFTQALNLRYGFAVVPLAAAVLAAELRRRSAATDRLVVGSLLLVGAATSVAKADLGAPWRTTIPMALVALGAVGVGVLLARRLPRPAMVATAAAVTLAGALATPRLATHFDASRLGGGVPAEPARLALAGVEGPLAVAGFCQISGLYDPDLGRHVEYLTGDDETIDRPLFATESEWLQSLAFHGVTALVLGSDICYSELDLPYARWVANNPDVFQSVPSGGSAAAYLVTDPGRHG